MILSSLTIRWNGFVALTSILLCCLGCRENVTTTLSKGEENKELRLISTSPSITETLFELGLGESVVATSNFCNYPPEVKELPKIGTLNDFNIEAIVELAPDFVVLLKEEGTLSQRLAKFGVKTIVVDHSSLEGVLDSLEIIGRELDRIVSTSSNVELIYSNRAKTIRKEMETRVEAVRKSVEGLPKTRVLISIYRTVGTGKIGDVYVAGKNPYFDSVLEISGAENVADGLLGAAPTVSAEGIIALNPEVIVDLSTDGIKYDPEAEVIEKEKRIADWRSLGTIVEATKTERIYPFLDDFATIPGPRAVLFIEKLADTLHPDRIRETSESNVGE